MKLVLLAAFTVAKLFAQETPFPLDSIAIDGSVVTREAVLAIAELKIGKPVDKAKIEDACRKLQAAGLFDSVSYRYAPGANGGIALNLSLTDQRGLTDASIDVPGLDDTETWEWLKARFPNFDRRVPGAEAAQQYLAASLDQHLQAKLRGQHLVARMEDDLKTRRLLISFQPETLPRLASIAFIGQREIPADKLNGLVAKYAQSQGYTDRGFRQVIELNLRPAYENLGLYRVKFPSIAMRFVDDNSVAVTISIDEGQRYTLGAVTVKGDGIPADEMLTAGHFKKGEIANWSQIQQGIYAAEIPLKRRGYLREQTRFDRVFDEEQHVLNLTLEFVKGPQFHFGSVRFQGLSPDLEAHARKLWTLNAGEPYDESYAGEFIRDLAKSTAMRQYKKFSVKPQPGSGEHVMDVTLIFE